MLYNNHKLFPSIDAIKLKSMLLDLLKIRSELSNLLNKIGCRLYFQKNNYLIIENKHGSSIAKIYNNKINTYISMYGPSQTCFYQYNHLLPDEFKIIMSYFISSDILIELQQLDLALDYHYAYQLTKVEYSTTAKKLNISNNDVTLNYLTDFSSITINIPLLDNDELIARLKKKSFKNTRLKVVKVNETAHKHRTRSYRRWSYIDANSNFKSIEKEEATYMTISIKNAHIYSVIMKMIEEAGLNINYSLYDYLETDVIIKSNTKNTSIILYNKHNHDSKNDKKLNSQIAYLKHIKEQHYPNLKQKKLYHHNRVEIRQKFKIELHNVNNFIKIIESIFLTEVAKLKILIFKNNENLKKYKNIPSILIKQKELILDRVAFQRIMDDLENALKVPFIANSIHKLKSAITKTNNSSPLVNKNKIGKNNKKMKKKEERNNQEANNLIPLDDLSNLTTG